jgi:hypothetical protein
MWMLPFPVAHAPHININSYSFLFATELRPLPLQQAPRSLLPCSCSFPWISTNRRCFCWHYQEFAAAAAAVSVGAALRILQFATACHTRLHVCQTSGTLNLLGFHVVPAQLECWESHRNFQDSTHTLLSHGAAVVDWPPVSVKYALLAVLANSVGLTILAVQHNTPLKDA